MHGATPISAAVGSGVMGPKLTAEEARLQETVLGEVLQQGGSVKWADVAGLPSAKQVQLPGPGASHCSCLSQLLLFAVTQLAFHLFLAADFCKALK